MTIQPHHKKWAIIAGSLLALAILSYGGYRLYKKYHADTHNKSYYVNYLIGKGLIAQTSATSAMGYGDDFIEAWYGAAKKDKETFDLLGKTYLTKGGKAVK